MINVFLHDVVNVGSSMSRRIGVREQRAVVDERALEHRPERIDDQASSADVRGHPSTPNR